MLTQYLHDIKENEKIDVHMQRLEVLDQMFAFSKVDFIFPWHMRLGKYEVDEHGDFPYTPFKTFNRRRNFLIWTFNDRFDTLFSEDEKAIRNKAENQIFWSSLGLKALSVFLLMNLRFYKRPVQRSWFFDLGLFYGAIYSFLGCNIPGVFYNWPNIEPLFKRMI